MTHFESIASLLNSEAKLMEQYNENGQLVGLIDERGNETSFSYNEKGLLISVESNAILDAWDQPYRADITYSPKEKTAKIVESHGVMTALNEPLKIDDLDGSSKSFECDDPYDTETYVMVTRMWDHISTALFHCVKYIQLSIHQTKMRLNAELKFHDPITDAIEKNLKWILGESIYQLMGPHFEETDMGCYGEGEISDKVRVTFINGILNTRTDLSEALQILSESHGGVNIHYVFRPTEGWTWDISRSVMIKLGFVLGFRSLHAHLLAQLWHNLILDMGGSEGGGTIIHYAHSLGGTETDRARELLTPEEQQMIRVVTFGSSTLIRNEGFQDVLNNASRGDGVIYLDPFGHVRNFFDPDSNVIFHSSIFERPYYLPTDHFLNGGTYGPLIRKMGEHFMAEFGF